MKPTHFSISIPEPCGESWEQMTLCERGRFCGSCQKTVIDFTGYSDAELAAFFSRKENENTCGRFYVHQIENKSFSYTAPVKKPYRTLAMAASVAALTVISFTAEAQNVRQEFPVAPTVEAVNTPAIQNASADTLIIEGTVTDEKGEPILSALIQIKVLNRTIAGVSTDLDGKYRLAISYQAIKSDTLNIECDFFTKERSSIPIQSGQMTHTVDFVLKKPKSDNTESLISVGLIIRRPNPPLIDKDNPGSSTIIPASSLEKMPY